MVVFISLITAVISAINLYINYKMNKISDYKNLKKELLTFPKLIDNKENNPTSLLLQLRLIFEEINLLGYKEHKSRLNQIAFNYFLNLQQIEKSNPEKKRFNALVQVAFDNDFTSLVLPNLEPMFGSFKDLTFNENHDFLFNTTFNGFLFDDCTFDNIDFINTNFQEVIFKKCHFQSVNFSNNNLNNIDFQDSRFDDVCISLEQLASITEDDFNIKTVDDVLQNNGKLKLENTKKDILYLTSRDASILKEDNTHHDNILENDKISQKIFSYTRHIFHDIPHCNQLLAADLNNPKVTNIYIKESMNHSDKDNLNNKRNNFTSWFSINEQQIKETSIFYFIIKNSKDRNNSLVFRFPGSSIREELIGTAISNVNNTYNVYIAKRENDSFFVNDRVKQDIVYLKKKNLVYGGRN